MYDLPKSVFVNEVEYLIRNQGDYRMVLDCFQALNDIELEDNERLIVCLIMFYEDFNELEEVLELDDDLVKQLTEKMFNFFNCGQPDGPAANRKVKTIDWVTDEQLISSAVNKVAGTEVRSLPYCHWWTFMGYFCEIGESTLSTVVGIRDKIAKGKKLEKYESEFKNNNPQYFTWDMRTAQQKEEDDLILELWNKG